MKLVTVSSYPILGGAELALASFLEHRPDGIEPAVVVLGDGPLVGRLRDSGITTIGTRQSYGRPGPRQLAAFTAELGEVLRSERPDVVWAVGLKAATMSLVACRRDRTPLVWHKVDLSRDRAIARPLALACDGVIAVSHAAAGALGPWLRRRRLLGVVGPPVMLDAELESSPDSSRPLIGTLGTLLPIKGHHHVLEAAAMLVDEFPELGVVIAGAEVENGTSGTGSGYRGELLELAGRLGIAERVQLPGFVDPSQLLARLSVYVSATYRQGSFGFEGLSGAMLEASWAGVPVVATRGGGTAEGIVDGVTGTLVEPRQPRQLADAIAAYLRDPELASRVGAAGRQFARERFAPEIVAPKLFGYLRTAGERTR